MKRSLMYGVYVLFLFVSFKLNAQTPQISNKSIKELENIIDHSYDTLYLKPYLYTYLEKAKKEGNKELIFRAYQKLSYKSSPYIGLKYADSTIEYAQKINTDEALAEAYSDKAAVLYGLNLLKSSLDYNLLANRHAKKTNNIALQIIIKHGIANIKFYLEEYKEALSLFQYCSDYFKENNNIDGYLLCEYSLSLCYSKLKNYKESSATNKKAMEYAVKNNDSISIAYINHSEAINSYYTKEYNKSQALFKSALPKLKELDDTGNIANTYFYLGKDFLALHKTQLAYLYFKKVDSIFTSKKYVKAELRENFELLLKQARQAGDIHTQLYYTNRLMQVDSILRTNYKYISQKVTKDFDTRTLQEEKVRLENELKYRKTLTISLYAAVAILLLLILYLIYRYLKNQKKYKKRFEELLGSLEKQDAKDLKNEVPDTVELTIPEATNKNEEKKPVINPEVVNAVLEQLKKFEEKNKFTKKDLTLNELATMLNTNANYLSKIINYYKDKSFSNYLNDLRVDYIIELLRRQPKYRNYTIKALAEEAGFANAQHFSKAFYAHTGLYPSFFVNEMNEVYGNMVLEAS